MDAAIAATAVLGVVEPYNLGVGGDSFVLYRLGSSGRILAYNGSGRAPAKARADWYREQGYTAMPDHGPHAVVVPGAVDTWLRLSADHGTRGLDEVLAPAIDLAADGYVVQDVVAYWWRTGLEKLRRDPVAAKAFLNDGMCPEPGDVHRQPLLAETLRGIAKHGREGFYAGAVAEDMVETLRLAGGLHSVEDFATAEGNYVEPISSNFKGYDIYECPPNGQGIVALLMLNILSKLASSNWTPLGADRLHAEIEAGRLAMRDRDRLIGDPDHGMIPVDVLLSDRYAREFAASVSPTRAMNPLPRSSLEPGKDTSHVCIVDDDGNAVSYISSLFQSFGSGIVCPRSGVVLNNRAFGFSLSPGHPNVVGPRKRPLHTIIPGLAVKPGQVVMPFGVVGGHYQPWGHAHVAANVIDFGLDVQEALDLARVFHNGENVTIEAGVPDDVAEALTSMGHTVQRRKQSGDKDIGPLGGGQIIHVDLRTGVLSGAADPRMDGCALGY